MKVPPADRPREKLLRLGPSALGDNELVAIVIGHETVDVANGVLRAIDGAHALTRTSADDLQRIRGIGPAKAAQILAATELGRRTLVRPADRRPQILTPQQAAEYIIPLFGSRPLEQFGVVLLDTKHRVLRVRIVSTGSVDSTMVHPREVFREAALAQAYGLLLFHNHPSGDPTPSADDVRLTRRLQRAGDVMGIDVVDHVIVADDRYFSFREAGRL
jgi:DNA repair protein RadC